MVIAKIFLITFPTTLATDFVLKSDYSELI